MQLAPSVAMPVEAPAAGPAPVAWGARLLRFGLAVAAILAAPQLGAAAGLRWKVGITLALLAGLVALELFPRRAHAIALITGLAVLFQWVSLRYFGYHLLLLGATFALRRQPRALLLLLLFTVVIVPKELFRTLHDRPFLWDWTNPFMLGQMALVAALFLAERRRGRVTGNEGFWSWGLLFTFPTHPMNPLNIGPHDLWRARAVEARALLSSLVLLAAKAGALWLLIGQLPQARFGAFSGEALLALSWPALWGVVGYNYLVCALTLSGTGDVVVLVARALGWPLAHPFRFALLAWNPVELWRRWAIYNRKLLLSLVYFPMGGNRRHRYLNVLATFLASGVVLHTGWLGSAYWRVGVAGWRDQIVYFVLQGLAVCACLAFWQRRGKDPAADRDLRLSAGRVAATVATQALSAWLHIIVLAGNVEWGDRWRVMGRCLGLPL